MFREIRTSERISDNVRRIQREHDRLFMEFADCIVVLPNGERNPRSEELYNRLKEFEAAHRDIYPEKPAFDPDARVMW